jgi:hypothetical protein
MLPYEFKLPFEAWNCNMKLLVKALQKLAWILQWSIFRIEEQDPRKVFVRFFEPKYGLDFR